MTMIDSEHIKYGLKAAQEAKARHAQALSALSAAQEAGQITTAQLEAVQQARQAYVDECIGLFGYIRAAVNQAEGRPIDQDG